jgi:hypothetical protein
MPHPSSNHLISRVRDFCRWQEKLFGDPSAQGAPVEDPSGWATDKEFWIRNNVWRDTIFEGNAGDATAAADALIDHGLLRAKRRERVLQTSCGNSAGRRISRRASRQLAEIFVIRRESLTDAPE